VQAFLAPIELADGLGSVQLARHPDWRPTGEAYVALRTESELLAALQKHKSSMGKRYIEVRRLLCNISGMLLSVVLCLVTVCVRDLPGATSIVAYSRKEMNMLLQHCLHARS
jgi:hypothetical protein